ncbi:MAG TPA: uracil-DNA glycosylase [Steroidobacteraceae bacterium]|nr:uracil-DNA glycosylase [Steroidobacteraceae bacterium]
MKTLRPASEVADRAVYDPSCARCPRLVSYRSRCHDQHPDYWCRPVPSFGDPAPRIVLVGLAPGLHGANRTGRPFTGDHAGILLYETLFRLGFANQPTSVSADDPLRLRGVRIVNAVKCVPPENKPLPEEIRRCNAYLHAELAALEGVRVLVALGRIGHDAALTALALKRSAFPFGHGREHRLDATRYLLDSYHCSRYNTQTRRLTAPMFRAVLERARELAEVRW